MKLSESDADLFFELMRRLQLFVNRERGLFPGVDSVEAYSGLSQDEKAKVRNAVWEDPGLIDAYVAGNPDGLPAKELAIVEKWKRFVSGTFFITRFLKKHAVFISEHHEVYAVLALHDPLEDVLFGRRPPIIVKTVLLPFEGRIVYDGILALYNIHIGGGIRGELNEAYMRARQQGRIVETLEPEDAPGPARRAKDRKPGRDWRSEVDDLVEKAARMKGGPAPQSAAFGLLRASANLARVAVHEPEDPLALRKPEQQVRRALTRLQRAMDRADLE